MLFILRCIILSLLCFIFCIDDLSNVGIRVMSVILEKPVLEYENKSYGRLINVTSRRYSRRDSTYYLQIYGEIYVPFTKRFIVHIRIDEFSTYTTKRRFFDRDLNLCKFIELVKNNILYKKSNDEKFRKYQFKEDCVLQAGIYYLHNITWYASGSAPLYVPFKEGRMEVRVSDEDHNTVFRGRIQLNSKDNL